MNIQKITYIYKKTVNIISILLLVFILSSCFTSKDDINKAKQNIGIVEVDDVDINSGTNSGEEIKKDIIKDDNKKSEEIIVKEEEKKIEIKSLTEEQFLEFDSLEGENLLDGEVEIKGKTLANVDKIVVNFINEDSDFPVDKYTLKQFKTGAKDFLYRAFSRYETLDFGKNIYVFEAYSGEKISKLQIIINVVKEEEKGVIQKVEQVYEDVSINTLPVNAKYGSPVDLGGGKITYSDLNGLEIKTDVNPDLTCENVTSILANKIESWFYWNTCLPIKKDEGISFFVIRLDGDKYVYEKHYYLFYYGLYGIQELEVGTGTTNKNISEKNTQLKEKNKDYSILEITDELFKEILK